MSLSKNYAYEVELFLKKELKGSLKHNTRPNDVGVLKDLIKKVNQAVHFSLPDEGIEFEQQTIDHSKVDKIPYPLLTIETHVSINNGFKVPIVILVQRHEKDTFIKQHHKGLVLFDMLDILTESSTQWVIQQVSFSKFNQRSWFCEPVSEISIMDDVQRVKHRMAVAKQARLLNKKAPPVVRMTVPLLFDQMKKLTDYTPAWTPSDYQEYIEEMTIRYDTCRRVFLNFHQAMMCENVVIESDRPMAHGRAKRRMGTKRPPASYEKKILTLDIPPTRTEKDPQNGTHRSPRPHLRRGHVRVYPSGKRVWIEAIHVNKNKTKAGFVDKSYELRNAH